MENLIVTEKIRRSSIHWLLTIQEECGNEVAMKCYDIMREGFGEDLAGAVLFGIMSNDHGTILRLRWRSKDHIDNKIQAIKAVRMISGLGLGEAKHLVESAASHEVECQMIDGIDYETIRIQIREIEAAGLDVR